MAIVNGFAPTGRGSCLVVGVLVTSGVLLVNQPTGAAEAPVGLGTAGSFSVLAGAGVTNTGPTTVNGDLGTCPTPAITGFPPGVVNGATHANDAVACGAKSDLTTAYNDAAGRAPTTTFPAATELGGMTLAPGVYKSPTSFAITGPLTLDGQGDPSAVFIFQAGSTLITAVNSSVVPINGAQACNVFWQIGSSATLGVGSTFLGTIMALTDISANTNATIQGRLLARNGAVTLDSNTVSAPTCTAPPTTVPATTTTAATTTTSAAATTTVATTTTLATTATTEAPAVTDTTSPSAVTSTPSATASSTTSTTRLAAGTALPAGTTGRGSGRSASRTGTGATAGAAGSGVRLGTTAGAGGSGTSLTGTGTGTGSGSGSGGNATSITSEPAPGPGETVALARTGSPLWTQTFLGVLSVWVGLLMVSMAGQASTSAPWRRQVRPIAWSGPVRPPVLLLNEPWTPDKPGPSRT